VKGIIRRARRGRRARRVRIGSAASFAIAFVFTLTAAVGATVFVPTDLAGLTKDAAAILRGRVVSADGRWSDGHKTIETVVTVDVERYLKGDLGTTMRFTVPGGRVGRLRSVFVGAPQFSAGDRVILFLKGRAPALPFVVGLSQGVFRMVQSSSGAWLVTPPAIVATAGAQRPIVRGDAARRPVPVDSFERQVRDILAAQGDR